MTEFLYNEPICFKVAKEYFNQHKFTFDDKTGRKYIMILLHERDALREAKWNWLKANASNLFCIDVRTEDTDYAWVDMMRIYDNEGNEVYHECIGLGERSAKKRLKSKLKRFGLSEIPISIRCLS